MKFKRLLIGIVCAVVGFVVSVPISFTILGILWIFVFGDNAWPNIFGIEPFSFVLGTGFTVIPIISFLLGFFFDNIQKRLGNA